MRSLWTPMLFIIVLSGCVAHAPQSWQLPGSRTNAPQSPPAEPDPEPAQTESASAPAVRTFATTEDAKVYQGVKVRRWSAVTANLDATIALYTEVLGMELGSVTTDPSDSYVYDTFNIDPVTVTRHAVFHAGEDRRAISVVEYAGVNLNIPQSPRTNVLLLNANGRFDTIVTSLRRRGYKTMPVHALGSNGVELAFTDRNGHLYALYEIPYQGIFSDELASK